MPCFLLQSWKYSAHASEVFSGGDWPEGSPSLWGPLSTGRELMAFEVSPEAGQGSGPALPPPGWGLTQAVWRSPSPPGGW